MKPDNVIRIGDHIRVLVPRIVERVGYPLSYYSVYHKIEEDPRYQQISDVLDRRAIKPAQPTSGSLFPTSSGKQSGKIARAISTLLTLKVLEEQSYGGYERTLHYSELSPWERTMFVGTSNTLQVYGKRIAKTGTYRSPSGGYDSYTGEYWYEDGGLDDCKTHVLVRTTLGEFDVKDVEKVPQLTSTATK